MSVHVELLSGVRPVDPVEPPQPKESEIVVDPLPAQEPWVAPESPHLRRLKTAPAAPARGPPDLLAGYVTREALAAQFNVGFRTLERWAVLRIGPKITYVGRTPYYAIADVQAWLANGGLSATQRRTAQRNLEKGRQRSDGRRGRPRTRTE
jgi:hypothetical protein